MNLQPRSTPGASVTPVENGWQLEIPAGQAGVYRLAQLDDYMLLPRNRFAFNAPVTLSLRCRGLTTSTGLSAGPGPSPKGRGECKGTWGFGLWNDPFAVSLGLGGAARRLPALPNACWFFHASEENYLSFASPTRMDSKVFAQHPVGTRLWKNTPKSGDFGIQQPGNGFLAQVFSSPRIPAWALTPGLLAAPLLLLKPVSKWLRLAAGTLIREKAHSLEVDVAQWHEYRLRWRPQGVEFAIDGENILETEISPQGPLGLVIWIDNQFMAWKPNGSLKMGTLANAGMGIEIKDLGVKSDEGETKIGPAKDLEPSQGRFHSSLITHHFFSLVPFFFFA